MTTKVKVEFEKDGIKQKMEISSKYAIEVFTKEVLKGTQPYVPKRDGTLERSAINNSRFKEGLIIWSTPYARRLYYNVEGMTFSKSKNAKATDLWFEAAKKDNKEKWTKQYKKLFGDKFNK